MKLIIDTCLENLFIALVNNNKTVDYFLVKEKKKADLLPSLFKKLLDNNGASTKDIKEFYVTKGPGSFMGARTAITFARTICHIQGSKLFTTDTLTFISCGNPGTYYIDAKSNQSYQGVYKDNKINLSITKFHSDSKVDYEYIVNDPEKCLALFSEDNPISNDIYYLKEPRIGGK